MAKKQSGLGRGLGALLGDTSLDPVDVPVTTLPLQKVEPNPLQPRQDFDPEAPAVVLHGISRKAGSSRSRGRRSA